MGGRRGVDREGRRGRGRYGRYPSGMSASVPGMMLAECVLVKAHFMYCWNPLPLKNNSINVYI